MMSPLASTPARAVLDALAPSSAATWHALATRAFAGELSVATDDSVYRFKNAALLGCATKPARGFDSSREMRELRLIGFVHDEGGFWSLSPSWREGAQAVLWRPDRQDGSRAAAITITSPTLSFTLEEPEPEPKPHPRPFEPKPSPWKTRAPSESHVALRRVLRPPTSRQPLPASMTRIHCGIDVIGG